MRMRWKVGMNCEIAQEEGAMVTPAFCACISVPMKQIRSSKMEVRSINMKVFTKKDSKNFLYEGYSIFVRPMFLNYDFQGVATS